jgi:ABC-type Mn2+/Zn2+ transport system permease subunit
MTIAYLLAQGFVQRAVIAAALLGIACGVLSFFVVQRRLAFMGHGIAHSMVAGVGIGVLLSWPVFWPALAVAVLVAVGVGWIARRDQVSEDSAIGITLSAALALGLVLVSLKQGYVTNLEAYLFGSLVAVLPADVLGLAILAAAVGAAVLVWWRVLLLFTFDPEGAAVAGYPAEVIRYGLLLCLALTVAVAMKIVGILLVGAFLVIPAAAAGFWSTRPSRVVWLSVAFALVASLAGILFSVTVNSPAGASVVVMLMILFLCGRFLGPYRK